MKLFDIDGPKLMDQADSATFDLVLKNTPVFIAKQALAATMYSSRKSRMTPRPTTRRSRPASLL